jgi:ligand-binding sensor domain-containing protein/two-component sensor histidine kinase
LIVLAILLIVLAGGVADAFGQRLPLRTYSSADGLAGDHVSALLPDSRGFLWIGTTTGLSRFDGREFRTFGAADGLPHPSVNALLEDRDGVIWVATRRGLVRIEPQARTMSPVRFGDGDDGNAAHNILHVIQTRDGRVWAADPHHLYIFASERDRRSPTRIAVPPPTPPPTSLEQELNTIESIAEGRDGDVWIGTTWGLVRRLADGRMIPMVVRPTAQDDRIYHLAIDRDGRLWITHWGIAHRPGVHFGIYVLAPEPASAFGGVPDLSPLHERARLVSGASGANSIMLPTRPGDAIYMTAGGPLGDARVQHVLPASDGTIWIATEDGLVHVAQGRATRYDERNGLGVPIRVLARDARGDLWLGTRGTGLMRLEMDGFVAYTARDGLPSGEVGGIIEDATGTLCLTGNDASNGQQWFGTFDREHERLVRFKPKGTEQLRYWGWGWRQLFLRDHQGEWWLPTGEGLFRYPASASCTSIASTPPLAIYTHRDGLPIDEIFRLFEDSRGDLWMSVGSSPVRWLRRTATFEVVSDRVNPPTTFVEDRAGNVWMGFYRGGIARWRGGALQMFETRDGVPDGFVQTLFVDSAGRLWIGTEPGGLARIDDPTADTPRIERPGREPGLTNIGVTGVIEDRQKRLYVGTGRGLLRFDSSLAHPRTFLTSDGLSSNEIHIAFADRHGSLWFGTHRGLSRLDPRPDATPAPPTIFIDSLHIAGVPQPLSQLGAQVVDDVRVEPESRRLEIGYGSPSLAPGETRRYQVRLQGVDPDWGLATTNRTALYLNLAPGGYRFEARAVDPDGLVSTQPAAVLFTILPPIWQRAWFRLLAGIAIIAAGYLAYRSRVRHLLALERMRSRIATDLHDDLGARLSRISILSEVAARRVSSDAPSAERLLGEVGETARSLIEAAADIAWSVDPAQDDLTSLAARIRRFAADILDARDLAWTFEVPEDGSVKLSPERRRHVLLVFQEAINNIVRHAQARRVTMRLRVSGGTLEAEIADDGRGIEATSGSTDGRGLPNMRARARELGGDLTITSGPGSIASEGSVAGERATSGTRVHLAVPLR